MKALFSMKHRRSAVLYEEAQRVMPGGVNSPVRAFAAVGGTPRFAARGEGSRFFDVDGNEYIDYVMSWGPLILGHAHPPVIAAIERASHSGTSFGAPTESETALAELIATAMPSIELVRLTSSGTEASMSALRLARAFTGRAKIVKCAGCYHGHADSLLVEAGSGALTFGVPGSAGVPASYASETIVVPYNNAAALRKVFDDAGGDVACFIVEPVAGNMGVVEPQRRYLESAREITAHYKALLIFDEVITGFRVAYGGAQAKYGVNADLTCLGKIIGGGLPVGAFGGRRDIMERVAPAGDVYQAGTLSGNPLAVAAGLAQLGELSLPGVYERLERNGAALQSGLERVFRTAGHHASIARVGSMWTAFFTRERVTDLASARTSNTAAYAKFFHGMLERGVYLPPSQFETCFLSTAHSPADIEKTLVAAEDYLGTDGARSA